MNLTEAKAALNSEFAEIENGLREQGHAEYAEFFRRAQHLAPARGPVSLNDAKEIEGFASALDEHGHSNIALPLYFACFDVFAAHAEPAEMGSFLMNFATVNAKLGKHAEAVAGFDAALPVLKEHAPPADYANCLMNRSAALRAQGKHAEAVSGYDAALPVLKQHAPPADYARCLMNRAIALQEQGKYAEAVSGYDAALPVLKQHAPPASYARCLMNRAIALRAQGKHAEAVAGFDAALPVLKEHAPPADYANCLMNRSAALRAQGKHAEAVSGYDAALPVLKQHAPPADYARCLMNRAIALRAQGKYAEAVAGYDAALPVLKQHAPPADYARCLMNRAATLQEQGKHAEAVSGYDAALPVLKQHAPPASYANCLHNRASALGHLANEAKERGHSTEAVEYANQAAASWAEAQSVLRSARQHAGIDDTVIEFNNLYELMFRLAIRNGLDHDLTDAAYDAVRGGKAGVYEDIAHKLSRTRGPEPEIVFQARGLLTDLLRTKVPATPKGELTEESVQQFVEAHEHFDAAREGYTQQYLALWGMHAHAYDASRTAAPTVEDLPTRQQIQEQLAPGTALVDFWHTGKDEYHAFVLFADDFRVVKLPMPIEALKPRLAETANSLHRISYRAPQVVALDDLGKYLFAPLMPLLREKNTHALYLVPHQLQHLFPLCAARVEGKYLCDEFALAHLPSANLLPKLPKPDARGTPFVLANPEHGTPMSLPFAHWEGEQLKRQLAVPPSSFFLGETGRYAATDNWANAGYVHFSCHGSADDRFAPRSHLRLSDDLLLAHDVLHRKPDIRTGAVVVLNGCQTSATDFRAVNENMGLMSAFLTRGAGAVLSTQWSVVDMCAAQMALTFAREVRRNGATPAAALRTAQNELRRTKPEDMLGQIDSIVKDFASGTIEKAKLLEQRAWLCLRTGRFDEARASAKTAYTPLRDAGLRAESDALAEAAERAALERAPNWFAACGFNHPVFWSAFQLVGRIG